MSKLVVGGGYLGLRVARLWRDAGERVFVTSRRAERLDALAREGFEPVLFDVLAPRPLPAVDGVVHCVGFDRSAGVAMRRVYVEGLANVPEALPNRPRFVHVSSTGVYAQSDGGWVDESSETAPLDESGRVVLEAEHVLRAAYPEAIVLRFAGIYGPGRLLREAAVRVGDPIASDPDKWLNLIHVDDGATAVVRAEAAAVAGVTYNVTDDRPATRREFYSCLARLLGAAPPRFVDPPAPAPAHEANNRRVANGRLRCELALTWRFPDYEVGLAASVASG